MSDEPATDDQWTAILSFIAARLDEQAGEIESIRHSLATDPPPSDIASFAYGAVRDHEGVARMVQTYRESDASTDPIDWQAAQLLARRWSTHSDFDREWG